MKTPPVLFLIFNRPEETRRSFEQLRIAQPQQLFIAADGPRTDREGEAHQCEETKKVVNHVDWPCEVHTLFREQNLGCRLAVSEAIAWFFSNVSEGIILEDDCVPQPTFFSYCGELLEKYRHDRRVLSIGGSNLGYRNALKHSYGFTSFMNMWGWASWADRAQKIDYDLGEWGSLRSRIRLFGSLLRGQDNTNRFDYRWYKYWAWLFSETKSRAIETWDYQWVYHGLTNHMVSIFPCTNQISNIGFGASATHTHNARDSLAELPTAAMRFPLKHPEKIAIDKGYERESVQRKWNHHTTSRRKDLAMVGQRAKDWMRRLAQKRPPDVE